MASVANYVRYSASASVSNADASLVVSAGTKRKCVVAIPQEDAATITDVLFNSVSFVANVRVSIANSVSTTLKNVIYDYDIPDNVAADTYTVRVTTSAANANTSFDAWQLEGVATGAPEDFGSAEAIAGTANCTTTVDATDGAVVVGSYTNASGGITVSWSGGTVTESGEGDEATFTSSGAAGVASGTGAKTVTGTQSANSGRSVIVSASYAALSGPTITVQPSADVVLINGDPTRASAAYSVTATGTGSLSYDWELETSVGGGAYSNVADGSGIVWTGQAAASLTGVVTVKTLTGRRLRCNVTDDNGTTATNAVLLTVYTGPVLSRTTGTTNGSGVDVITIASDYPNGVGEFTVVTATAGGITETVSMVYQP